MIILQPCKPCKFCKDSCPKVDCTQSQLWGSRGASCSCCSSSMFNSLSLFDSDTEVTLDLLELGQVEGCDGLSLLNLLLVGFDLLLESVNHRLHALMVLPVLLLGVAQFLDNSLSLAQVLLAVREASVLSIELRLQLPDAGLHGRDGLLASLEGILFSLITSYLSILDLSLQ